MLKTLQLAWPIVVRNWRVYKKDFVANCSPVLAEPAFMLVALGAGLGAFVAEVQGRSYLAYLAPGLAVSTALFTAFFETSWGFYVKMSFESIFKAMLTTPIGVREIVLGELCWIALKGAVLATLVCVVLTLFGLVAYLPWLVLMPVIGALVAVPFGAIGLIASATVRNINQFQSVYSFIITPIFYLSGIFFPLTGAPAWFQSLVFVSPLYHGVRLAQMTLWSEFHPFDALCHVIVLLLYAALLVSIAGRLIRRKLIL